MAGLQLRISDYSFTPKIIPSLVTLILFSLLIFLGLWQLDRADEKRIIDDGVNSAIAKPALELNSFNLKTLSNEVYRSAKIKGSFDAQHQFLLDNRTHLGKPGYHVLTPFIFESDHGHSAVLINRGWITYQDTRENIPSIEVTEKEIEIHGTIKEVPRSIVLNETAQQQNGPNKPKLIQSVQIVELNNSLEYTLLPIMIELDKTDANGFIREWQPYYGSIDKHKAYATQWFSMAAILLFLYIKLNTKKR
jgi:surfeit locus 1 family protein